MVNFTLEKVDAVAAEAEELIAEANTGEDKVSINLAAYSEVQRAGSLLLFGMRLLDGKLIGLCSMIVQDHMQHSGKVMAWQDFIYVLREHRGGHVPYFLNAIDLILTVLGVQRVHRTVASKDYGPLLQTLGYEPKYRIYLKDLNNG